MSGLTALTKLQVSYTKQQYFVWHLDWLTVLTKLQFVKMQTYTIEVVLPRTIRTLTDLVELHLDCCKTYFDLKWNLLTLLERLCVYRGTVVCRPHCPLSGLLKLDSLKEVTLPCLKGSNRMAHRQLGQFTGRIKHARPDVNFSCAKLVCQVVFPSQPSPR